MSLEPNLIDLRNYSVWTVKLLHISSISAVSIPLEIFRCDNNLDIFNRPKTLKIARKYWLLSQSKLRRAKIRNDSFAGRNPVLRGQPRSCVNMPRNEVVASEVREHVDVGQTSWHRGFLPNVKGWGRSYVHEDTAILLYKAIIEPDFDYCCCVGQSQRVSRQMAKTTKSRH